MIASDWRFYGLVVCGALGLIVGGCIGGDGLPRQPVAGSITLDGQRLPSGVITFYPALRVINGTTVVGAAMIRDGRFTIPRVEGLTPGKYRVSINASDQTKARGRGRFRDEDDRKDRVSKELVPTQYNSKTGLEIEIQQHAIKEMKIELTSQ